MTGILGAMANVGTDTNSNEPMAEEATFADAAKQCQNREETVNVEGKFSLRGSFQMQFHSNVIYR